MRLIADGLRVGSVGMYCADGLDNETLDRLRCEVNDGSGCRLGTARRGGLEDVSDPESAVEVLDWREPALLRSSEDRSSEAEGARIGERVTRW